MRHALPLLAALALAGPAAAATIDIADGVTMGAAISPETGLEIGTMRAAGGFAWLNRSQPLLAGGVGCADGASMLIENGYNAYGYADCAGDLQVGRGDLALFDLLTLDIAAHDWRQRSEDVPAPSVWGNESFFEWSVDEDWVAPDDFQVVGYRGGEVTGRVHFGDTGGRTDLDVSALTGIDSFRIFSAAAGNSFVDDPSLIGYAPATVWCGGPCERIEVFGFDYRPSGTPLAAASFSAAAFTPLTAVPLPAGLPLLLGAVAALGLLRRGRG